MTSFSTAPSGSFDAPFVSSSACAIAVIAEAKAGSGHARSSRRARSACQGDIPKFFRPEEAETLAIARNFVAIAATS